MKAGWRITLAVLSLIASSACKESGTPMPELPPALLQHEEVPFGDRELARITRATHAALDLLEPRWGEITTKIYSADSKALPELKQQVQDGIPEGWQKVDAAFPAERGELMLYSSGGSLFGILVIPPKSEPVSPVIVLSNRG